VSATFASRARIAANRPRTVLVLGSGALQIGQAGEFDYSGSQAIKALREEGVRTVLINPNIATVQTSEGLADRVYFLPVDVDFVTKVIAEESVDAILLGFGGQTALNCGLALDAAGVLAKHGVRVLGTPLDAIRKTEDRRLFAEALAEITVPVARSRAASSPDEARVAAREIGFPVVLRAAFSLGGKGSAIAQNEAELGPIVERAFIGVPQVLVEECLTGWKELEYEVMRDADDNCIVVCNMENVDPMGIHTGDSIVVAPAQTLDDRDHQMLRDVALRTIRHLGIVGECNIQFALDPKSREFRVIEVNARLSRSSALASKATGYPLAYVAAKVVLGYSLPDLPNSLTGVTTAFFEPALDYIVCKVPRWDFAKFVGAEDRLGTEMKSVGEVMAIGRSFGEVLQKALRMLEIGVDGLDPEAFGAVSEDSLRIPTSRRALAIAAAFGAGWSVEKVHSLTAIDAFFLEEIRRVVAARVALTGKRLDDLDRDSLVALKRDGFADRAIALSVGEAAAVVRQRRHALGVRPHFAQIDTLAAEYPAVTNYLYSTYWATENDAPPTDRRKVLILGSGCYRIGSSVEFDWCCVNAAETCRALGYETVLLNCNPETVSTDYDVCDRLIFDEISLETVLEIVEQEKVEGVIVAMGGQTPNTLALQLHRAGVRLLGTSAESIDRAEDRRKFSSLCDELGIDQPRWVEQTETADLERTVETLGGFPVLVRPSYVLSGAAMRVAHSDAELRRYLAEATRVSPEHPVVISKFEVHAREVEIDGVARDGEIVCWAMSEHIEDAGVHSGDATLVLPPQRLYVETLRKIRRVAETLARALKVSGPFNIQVLTKHNDVKVIECNLRASRSFPFVSKTLGFNFIAEATRAVLSAPRSLTRAPDPFDLDHVAVKAPMFSFRRLSGVDPILGVEMASTGEVACFGDDADEALLKAMLAVGFKIPKRGVLLSLGPVGDKYRFTDDARLLRSFGLELYATHGTAVILREEGVEVTSLEKDAASTIELMRSGAVDLVVNIPREYDDRGTPDGRRIRRAAVDLEIPLITDLWLARRLVRALPRASSASAPAWDTYLKRSRLRE